LTEAGGRLAAQRKKIWNITLGIFFFILGLIGILIPVMPQLIFFFLSAIFFSRASKRFRRAVRRYRQRHPKVERAYTNWRRKARTKRQELIRGAKKIRRKVEREIDEMTGHETKPPGERDHRDAR
jgi:flagellar biosynthesis component FlhA